MLRKLLISSAAIVFGAASASAADLPSAKGPPVYVPPPAFNWTGLYVGLNAGGDWGSTDPRTSTVFSPTGYFAATSVTAINATGRQAGHTGGFTGGGQIGYNQQITNFVVAGVETDFDYLRVGSSDSATTLYPCCAPTSFTVNSSVSANWLWTLRPRVGYLATPGLLVYATGGLALSDVRGDFRFTDTFADALQTGSISRTRAGWVVGGGLEYALTPNWSIKGEYLYADLGRSSAQGNNLTAFGGAEVFPSSVFTHSTDPKLNIVRVGVNYKFDFLAPPAPVVAKY